jgi:histidyl-tRNA synthetase
LGAWPLPRKDMLDDASRKRLTTNPLRILDNKQSQTLALLEAAPTLLDYRGDASTGLWNKLLALLDAESIDYRVDQKLRDSVCRAW